VIEDETPTILFERSGVTALAKPAGLPTQAPAGIPSVESWVRGRLAAGAYVGIPHRLDRAVSGVLLVATTPRAARQLSRQFERRVVAKGYVAIVAPSPGSAAALPPTGAEGLWADTLAKVPGEARGRVVSPTEAGAREALTLVRPIGTLPAGPAGRGERVILALEPRTGRMHQLRIQAAARGLPLVGDTLYGGPAFVAGASPDDPRSLPIALHARWIRFLDPDLGEGVDVVAPLPRGWPDDVRGHVERCEGRPGDDAAPR